jgi:hypothetical protein
MKFYLALTAAAGIIALYVYQKKQKANIPRHGV